MTKQVKTDKSVCHYCKIPIREIHFAYWIGNKIHCSLGCASKTKDKTTKVNRWKQKA